MDYRVRQPPRSIVSPTSPRNPQELSARREESPTSQPIPRPHSRLMKTLRLQNRLPRFPRRNPLRALLIPTRPLSQSLHLLYTHPTLPLMFLPQRLRPPRPARALFPQQTSPPSLEPSPRIHRFSLMKSGAWSPFDLLFGSALGTGSKCDLCNKRLGWKPCLECDDCGLRRVSLPFLSNYRISC